MNWAASTAWHCWHRGEPRGGHVKSHGVYGRTPGGTIHSTPAVRGTGIRPRHHGGQEGHGQAGPDCIWGNGSPLCARRSRHLLSPPGICYRRSEIKLYKGSIIKAGTTSPTPYTANPWRPSQQGICMTTMTPTASSYTVRTALKGPRHEDGWGKAAKKDN